MFRSVEETREPSETPVNPPDRGLNPRPGPPEGEPAWTDRVLKPETTSKIFSFESLKLFISNERLWLRSKEMAEVKTCLHHEELKLAARVQQVNVQSKTLLIAMETTPEPQENNQLGVGCN